MGQLYFTPLKTIGMVPSRKINWIVEPLANAASKNETHHKSKRE
jgi:hypothetical protein